MKNHRTKTQLPLALASSVAILWSAAALGDPSPAPPVTFSESTSAGPFGIGIKVQAQGGGNGANSTISIGSPVAAPMDASGATKKVTSLGVSVSPVPSAVAAQLPLDQGVGLLVTHVVKESAAARAGLAENDVLEKLDDQILVEPGQLRTLVGDTRAGDKVRLDIYRKGTEQTVTATLATGETSDAGATSVSPDGTGLTLSINDATDQGKADIGKTVEALIAKQAGDYLSKALGDHGNSANTQKVLASLPGLLSVGLSNASVSTKVVNSLSNEATETDSSGTVSITKKDGHTHLRAADQNQKVLFEGDIDSPGQQAKAPAAIMTKARGLLDDLNKADEGKAAAPQ